ncbi:MAG: 2,3-bisphosphoglycerate-independent phosphoglycerate mutase, partial [Deltaproteobacteria bacterium]|nr:2,3-bisphosphoglycerate-independent phosphoglycerate mutase [Deltaproteobacteria bacterium]
MRPVILIVMDGWGINPMREGNAVELAGTPNLKGFTNRYPSTSLISSGSAVGLPDGQMGNSEVGHLTLGAGRVVFQELTRINRAIEDGSFHDNTALVSALRSVKERGSNLHLMGLVSDGGVHSHANHLYA